MHRFRSWTLDPPEWRTQRNRLLSAEGGDGSTLNIDFTNGTLDPKLSHSRGSNASYINRSGLVRFADQNLWFNTSFDGATGTEPAGLGWQYFFTGGTVVWNGDGSVTISTSGGTNRRACARTTSIPNTQSKLVVSVDIIAHVGATYGTLTVADIFSEGSANTIQFYVNNSPEDSTKVITGPCTVTWVFEKVGAATVTPNFGVNTLANKSGAFTLRFANPRFGFWNGVAPFPYFRNTSTTAEYHAPRFDYDPTTLEPNGLLIEGNVSNLARYSDTLETTGSFWAGNAANRTSETSDINPTGFTGSMSFAPASNGDSRFWGLFLTGQTTTVPYTYSVWVKAKGTSSLVVSIQNSAGAVNINARIISQPSGATASFTGSGGGFPQINNLSSTGWTRIELTTTANLGGTGSLTVAMYPNNTVGQTTSNSVFAWGAQLEAGTGASSYIPTGSSSVTRVNDSVTFTDRNWFSSWTSTWFADYKIFNCTALPTLFYARSSQDGFNNYLNVVVNANHSLTSILSRSNSNAVQQWSTSNPVLSITEEFNKCAWVIDDTAKIANAGIIDFTSTSGRALPLGSSLSAFELGLNTVAGTSCSMWLKSLKYYPKALSNQELIDLTKPTIPSSSLDLDFTSGTLSSLLTFTRGSNATFITSTGLVQYAQSNEFRNTTWITSTTPQGWAVSFGTGTTTWNNNGTVTMDTGSTGTRPMINSSSLSVVLGMPYTFGYRVVSVSGSPTIANVIHSTIPTETFAINGQKVEGTTVVQNGDIVSCTFTPTSTPNIPPRMGPGVQGNMSNTVMTITEPQMNQGLTLQRYLPNTSVGAANYNTPRFTYDQTTLAPQGLLLEGNATNICTYSADMTQSGGGHWSVRTGLLTTGWTGFTAPDGTASAVKIIPDTTSNRHTLESSSTNITSGSVYTASAFVKADGYSVVSLVVAGSQTRRNFTLSGNGTVESQFGPLSNIATITPVGTNGWYRVTMTWTANFTGNAGFWIGVPQNESTDVTTFWSGNGTSGVQAWGAQLELGHGASSFIYTGASSAQRIQEQLYTTTGVSAWAGADSPNRSIFTDLTVLTNDPAHFPQIVWIGNTSLNYRDDVYYYNQSGAVQLYISGTYGGAPLDWSRTIGNTFVVPPQARKKLAIGLRPGTMVSTIDGTAGPTNAGSPSSLVLNALYLGPASQNSARKGSIILRSFKYWISRLNYSQLRFITG